jgi:hypothetical protein
MFNAHRSDFGNAVLLRIAARGFQVDNDKTGQHTGA